MVVAAALSGIAYLFILEPTASSNLPPEMIWIAGGEYTMGTSDPNAPGTTTPLGGPGGLPTGGGKPGG